jgi:hypothetical protein
LYENFPFGNLDLALAQHRLSQPSVATNPLPMTIDVTIHPVNSYFLKTFMSIIRALLQRLAILDAAFFSHLLAVHCAWKRWGHPSNPE